MTSSNLPLPIKVQDIVYRYRATPLSNNKTPAELYLGRNIRIKLDALLPYTPCTQKIPVITTTRTLNVGERVQARWYSQNKNTWKFGTIVAKFGKLHYQVQLDSGYSLKRHIDQLRSCLVENPETKPKAKEYIPLEDNNIPDANAELQILSGRPPQCYDDNNPLPPDIEPPQEPEPSTNIEPRRSQRERKPPSYLKDYVR